MLRRLQGRQERQFAGALFRASPPLATAWWTLLVLRALLPSLFAVASGVLINAVQHGHNLTPPWC